MSFGVCTKMVQFAGLPRRGGPERRFEVQRTRRKVACRYCIVKSKVSIRNDLHSLHVGRQVGNGEKGTSRGGEKPHT